MTDPQTAPVPQTPDPLADAVRSYLSRPRVDPARAALVGAAAQNPDQAAKTQRDAQVLGIPPAAAQGAPGDADLQARMKAMGLDRLSLDHPRTAAFLSDPQNAAVAHDDLPALKAMEITLSNGQKQIIDVGTVSADPRSAFTRFLQNRVLPTLQGFPLTRATIGTLGGSVGMLGDIGSFAGLHGEGGGPNALQRFQRSLDPSVTGADTITGSRHLPFDTISQNLGPLLPTMGLGAGTNLAARAVGLSERTAMLAAGATTGAAFTAQQGGQAFSDAIASGKTPDEARAIANRVALINAPANVILGSLAPKLRGATPWVLGAAQGASGQVSQNYVEGKPLTTDLLGGTVKGMAFMLGLHGAMETLASGQRLQDMTAIADQSKLRGRMPERFADAVNGMADGTAAENVRVPASEFDRVMAQKGLDPEEQAGLLNAKNYAEAKLSGSDLLIPTGDYLAHLAPTDAGKELAQYARLTPDALSDAELRSFQQGGAPDELTAQGKGLIAPDERASKIQAIQEDTQRQLEGAGFTPSVANTYAQLHANALANLAERAGIEPDELQRRFPLTVSREGLPEGDVPRGTPSEVQVQPVERRAGGDRAAQIRELIGKRKAGVLTPEEGERLHDLNEQERVQAKVAGEDIAGALNTTAYADEYAAGHLKAAQVFSDLDDFKRVNDTFGHAAGDQAIKAFGSSLVKHFGEGNVFYRGGDEFVAQHDDPAQARALMEQVRDDMAKFQVKGGVEKGERRQQTGVGLSYGVGPVSEHVNEATGAHDPSHEAELAQYADKAARKAAGLRVGVREDVPKGAEPTELKQVAFHGSPFKFDKFTLDHIGEGEGQQAFGWGLYFSGSKEIADWYHKKLSAGYLSAYEKNGKIIEDPVDLAREYFTPGSVVKSYSGYDKVISFDPGEKGLWSVKVRASDKEGNVKDYEPTRVHTTFPYENLNKVLAEKGFKELKRGNVYKVGIPEKDQMLHWDDPLKDQPTSVKQALAKIDPALLDKDYKGAGLYSNLVEQKGGKEQASKFLHSLGVEGIAYPAEGGKSKDFNFVVFDDKAIKTLDTYYQSQASGPARGSIRFGNGRGFKITLLDGADLSTFLHETGHLYTEVFHDLAQKDTASDQFKADYQTLRKHAGAAEGFEPLTTEQHETLARSLEAYLREGKAPSEGLRAVFERVKNWLKLIYRSALDLRVNLSDDVRQVFDRVYASDAEIEAAKARTGDQTNLFRSAAEMGVSQKEFEDYIGRTEARDRTAKDALRRVLVGDYERELTKAAKVEKEGIRAEVQQELDADPRYKAWDALKDGKTEDGTPVSISRDALVERYGEEAVKALPLRLKRLFSATGGLDADGAADLLGFRSGDALLANLKDLPPQKDAVAAEVDRRYKLQNPDALTDGTLPSKAVEELHNRSREEVLATELRALRRLQGARASDLEARRGSAKPLSPSAQATQASRAVPPAKAFRAAAQTIISDTQVRDLDPRGYLAAGRRAATEADTAFAAHDFAKAADAKQRELLSHHLYLEAVKAKSEVEKIAKRALGLQKPDAQARLAKAGGTYREQVNALLGRYEMTRVPLETLAKREGLAEWAQNQRDEGFEPDLSPEVLDEARRINYRQATVGELRAVGDALKTITHVARQQLEMVVNGKKVEFEATKDALKAAAKASGSGHGEPLSGTDKTVFQRIGSGLVGADAMMAKIERVFRMLDGDRIGPWTENFFKPIADAQGHYYELNRLVTKPLREAMQELPKNVRRGLSDTFEVDGFDQPINRRQLLTMAFNQGNEGNQRVLREGYGLTQEQVDAAFRNLSGDEARFVQKAWGILELLREPAGELQKRMTGLAQTWVESKPYTFQTKDGPVETEGGYFPLVRDPDRTTVGPKVSADSLLQNGYVKATTSKGYLEERTGATYPLLLDFQRILSQHVVGVTKDIAFREPAVAINKLMSDQSVRLAVDDSLGRAYRKQIEPWLRNILNDSNDTSAKGLRDMSTWVNAARRNVSAATIGFKLTSMLSIPTDLFRAWEPFRAGDSTSTRVSTKHLALAYKDFVSNPLEMTKQVRALSAEMRDRPHAIDRDIRSLFEHELVRPALTGNPLDAASALKNRVAMGAYEGFAVVDAMASVPTWLGAYRQAMEQGLPEEKARFQADATVRLSLEAGQPKDLVALQRNNDFTRLLTMFNGWGFSAYDLMRSLGRDAKSPAGVAKAAFYGVLGISVSNMMASLLTGHGPQKNENWGEWAARVGLLAPFEVVPVVRDLADSTVGRLTGQGGDMRISPVLTAFEKQGKALVAQGKFARGDMDLGDYLTITGEALGLLTGVPGTEQAVASSKYLRRVANGEEVPDNGADLAYHAAVGKPKGK